VAIFIPRSRTADAIGPSGRMETLARRDPTAFERPKSPPVRLPDRNGVMREVILSPDETSLLLWEVAEEQRERLSRDTSLFLMPADVTKLANRARQKSGDTETLDAALARIDKKERDEEKLKSKIEFDPDAIQDSGRLSEKEREQAGEIDDKP
jgi:hypothetical protein